MTTNVVICAQEADNLCESDTSRHDESSDEFENNSNKAEEGDDDDDDDDDDDEDDDDVGNLDRCPDCPKSFQVQKLAIKRHSIKHEQISHAHIALKHSKKVQVTVAHAGAEETILNAPTAMRHTMTLPIDQNTGT
ncbi:rRNA biogenesis protein rrp36-like [Rhopalosiphum maidis]|uniref:rRNA biogenesis protein rrp36-like n=1 Tax=Rhopalosiphum maidis TaxID=43146 RepID=UPI000EFECA82|nr:rRNA biogenesis protein rrp36-like [Rhopalosiphum maidis]